VICGIPIAPLLLCMPGAVPGVVCSCAAVFCKLFWAAGPDGDLILSRAAKACGHCWAPAIHYNAFAGRVRLWARFLTRRKSTEISQQWTVVGSVRAMKRVAGFGIGLRQTPYLRTASRTAVCMAHQSAVRSSSSTRTRADRKRLCGRPPRGCF